MKAGFALHLTSGENRHLLPLRVCRITPPHAGGLSRTTAYPYRDEVHVGSSSSDLVKARAETRAGPVKTT